MLSDTHTQLTVLPYLICIYIYTNVIVTLILSFVFHILSLGISYQSISCWFCYYLAPTSIPSVIPTVIPSSPTRSPTAIPTVVPSGKHGVNWLVLCILLCRLYHIFTNTSCIYRIYSRTVDNSHHYPCVCKHTSPMLSHLSIWSASCLYQYTMT